MSLVEAIKKFRQFKSHDMYCQTISWPVESQFVQNKPLNCTLIKELSKFVDNKLVDYAAIHGSIAATQESQITTHSCGQLDTNTNRSKDEFLRLPPKLLPTFDAAIEHISLEHRPQAHIEGQTIIRFGQQKLVSELKKNISYVTSYNVDYKELTLKANILTVSNFLDVSLETWIDSNHQPNQIIKDAIKTNLIVKVRTRCDIPKTTASEQCALSTLREIVSEQDFRKYLRYGFLLIKSSSGLIYQIWGTKPHTKVFWKGSLLEEICVRLNADTPPTDNVIAFKTMIEADEQEFRKRGNVYKKVV